MSDKAFVIPELPGYNCGSCGYKTCDEFGGALAESPELIKRCIHLGSGDDAVRPSRKSAQSPFVPAEPSCAASCGDGCGTGCATGRQVNNPFGMWRDSLGREFDFVLDLFPNEQGPRETIKLHNPMLTRELDIQVGDSLIGRPLGMSCGCPITHCGIAQQVDLRTGIIVWCVTGPLNPRQRGFKDLGYYSAEAYEGIVTETNKEIKVGMRYWFMPHKCMLQWRHSGLVNFVNKTSRGTQVRIEGLYIG